MGCEVRCTPIELKDGRREGGREGGLAVQCRGPSLSAPTPLRSGASYVNESNSPPVDVTVTALGTALRAALGAALGRRHTWWWGIARSAATDGGTEPVVAAGVHSLFSLSLSRMPGSGCCLNVNPQSTDSPFLGVGATISLLQLLLLLRARATAPQRPKTRRRRRPTRRRRRR